MYMNIYIWLYLCDVYVYIYIYLYVYVCICNVFYTQIYAAAVPWWHSLNSFPGDHPGRLDGSDCVVAWSNGRGKEPTTEHSSPEPWES